MLNELAKLTLLLLAAIASSCALFGESISARRKKVLSRLLLVIIVLTMLLSAYSLFLDKWEYEESETSRLAWEAASKAEPVAFMLAVWFGEKAAVSDVVLSAEKVTMVFQSYSRDAIGYHAIGFKCVQVETDGDAYMVPLPVSYSGNEQIPHKLTLVGSGVFIHGDQYPEPRTRKPRLGAELPDGFPYDVTFPELQQYRIEECYGIWGIYSLELATGNSEISTLYDLVDLRLIDVCIPCELDRNELEVLLFLFDSASKAYTIPLTLFRQDDINGEACARFCITGEQLLGICRMEVEERFVFRPTAEMMLSVDRQVREASDESDEESPFERTSEFSSP